MDVVVVQKTVCIRGTSAGAQGAEKGACSMFHLGVLLFLNCCCPLVRQMYSSSLYGSGVSHAVSSGHGGSVRLLCFSVRDTSADGEFAGLFAWKPFFSEHVLLNTRT